MSVHLTEFKGSVTEALAQAITKAIPDAKVEVNGAGGHFTIEVTSAVFAGKGMLESQRLVYSAITHLMSGANPPVHAVDSLKTLVPAAT
jgi:acid stress-induced BolA-like protein IbaG/YrbA